MTEKDKSGKASTGDDRIWDERLREALDLIERGNNYRARQILTTLRDEAPDQALRDSAREALRGIGVDPWFYVIWGISAAAAAAIFVYYILLR
jgi:hypothetical protein